VPALHVGIPRSLPRDRTAQRHTVSPTKIVPSSVTNSANRVSYSAAEKGKTDQLATDKQPSLSVVDDGLSQDNVTAMVCLDSDSVLPTTDGQPRKSDDVDNLTEECVHQSDETVVETAMKSDADAVPHECTLPANTVVSSDFSDDSLKNAGHVEGASEVCHGVSEDDVVQDAGQAECVSVDQPELLDSVSDTEKLLPAVSETVDEVAVLAVSCEDVVITEAHLPPVTEHCVIDTAVKLCSVSEEVDGAERVADIADESTGTCRDLMEAAVLSYIPEELTLCAAAGAAENKSCLADDDELLISCPSEQLDEASLSCLPSNVTVGSDDSAPVMSEAADRDEHMQSIDGGSLEAVDSSHSIDVFLSASPSFENAQSSYENSNLTETCTTDTQQLPADFQASESSAVETDTQDEDITITSDFREHVGFTIGESAITDGIFRRCSVDLAGRGIALSRIVEESPAGLAAVAGDSDQPHLQDGEQHITAGE